MGYTKKTTYLNKSAKTGVEYEYMVRAIYNPDSDNAYWSTYSEDGTLGTVTYCPTTTTVENISTKTEYALSWSQVDSATGYIVYRKAPGSSSWEKIQWIYDNTVTSYSDTSGKIGVIYYYKVRAFNEVNDVKYYSDFSSSDTLQGYSYFPDEPDIISAEPPVYTNSIRITWDAVNNATSYAVYRRTTGAEWKLMGYTKKTTYLNKSAKTGVQYEYIVRAIYKDNNGNSYWSTFSDFDIKSAVTYYPSTPTLNEPEEYSNGIRLTWDSIDEATGYRIFRKSSYEEWRVLDDVSSNEFTDTTVKKGIKYYYLIKSYNEVDGTTYWGQKDYTQKKSGIVYYTVNGSLLIGWNTIDDRSYYFNSFGELMSLTGIDVSSYQGTTAYSSSLIDWETVKNDGIDFAIIRIGWGQDETSQDDSEAIYNMNECERLGIPYGVYIYSYALTLDMVDGEIEHMLRLLKGRYPEMGVWFDMEDADGYKASHNLNPYTSGTLLTNMCLKFVKAIKAEGYSNVGTYANPNYFKNVLEYDKLNAAGGIWLAHWGVTSPSSTYSPDDLWQYTSDGNVDGIYGRVDMNVYIID